MIARAVQHAESRLRELGHEQWEDAAVAVAAFAFAVAATRFAPALVLPVFLGGVVVAARGVAAFWRRWDLLDRLVLERDAYTIPEVRARAVDAASPANRRLLATRSSGGSRSRTRTDWRRSPTSSQRLRPSSTTRS